MAYRNPAANTKFRVSFSGDFKTTTPVEQSTGSQPQSFKQTQRNKTFVKQPSPDTEKEQSMLRAEDVQEEFLVCGICTREYDEESQVPRILPCLHTFCQECLKKLTKGNLLACPLCKQKHELPKHGVCGFAKDTTRRNLIDFIKVRKRSSDILCKDCPDDATATDFCKECYIFMCSECTKAHKRSYASKKHIVLTIKELQTSSIDVFRRKMMCTQPGHEGQLLSFYCTKPGCETSICTACTVCDHERSKGHVIINVQDIYKIKKAEMDQLFKNLQGDISAAKFILQQMEQEQLNMDIKELEIEKDIDEVFERFRKILSRRQRKLKEELALACEEKKSKIQTQVEKLENYLDSAANAKDFSLHVLNHTDPTEFVPLHTTLLHRLRDMSNLKFDRQTLNIESPAFETQKVEKEFIDRADTLGEITSVTEQKRLSISRSHTHTGIKSASTYRQSHQDKRFGDILCPEFMFDAETVHQYREVSENCRILRNYATVQKQTNATGRRLKKYRGVVATRAFHPPGIYYFEVLITYTLVQPLDNINFVFEIGLCKRGDIDNGYYVYDQKNAWAFCAQHCEEHKEVCVYCRHYGYNIFHAPLSGNKHGTALQRNIGFLLDTDRGHLSILETSRDRKIFTFQNVDYSAGLWPVFGCHWPSKVKLELKLRTSREIESIPTCIQELS